MKLSSTLKFTIFNQISDCFFLHIQEEGEKRFSNFWNFTLIMTEFVPLLKLFGSI